VLGTFESSRTRKDLQLLMDVLRHLFELMGVPSLRRGFPGAVATACPCDCTILGLVSAADLRMCLYIM
jgi:hypothetical protein